MANESSEQPARPVRDVAAPEPATLSREPVDLAAGEATHLERPRRLDPKDEQIQQRLRQARQKLN